MTFLNRCPNCKEKTLTIYRKISLSTGGFIECGRCGAKCSVPSVMRLFLSIFIAVFVPTIFLTLWGAIGFINSLILTSLLTTLVYCLLAYVAPLEVVREKKRD